VPYTHREQILLTNLIDKYGEAMGHDVFNKMRAKGSLGPGSKDRMEARSAEARKA
jgi:hypothetical protein